MNNWLASKFPIGPSLWWPRFGFGWASCGTRSLWLSLPPAALRQQSTGVETDCGCSNSSIKVSTLSAWFFHWEGLFWFLQFSPSCCYCTLCICCFAGLGSRSVVHLPLPSRHFYSHVCSGLGLCDQRSLSSPGSLASSFSLDTVWCRSLRLACPEEHSDSSGLWLHSACSRWLPESGERAPFESGCCG